MNIDLHSSISNVGNFPSSVDDANRLSLSIPAANHDMRKKDCPKPSPTKESCEEKPGRRLKKWKKPKDKPTRPLSAYNLFFRSERSIMLGVDAPNQELESLKKRVHCKTHGKIGFAEMARVIGARWKSLDSKQRKVFELQALKEKKRYKMELASWKESRDFSPQNDEEQGLEAVASAALQHAEGKRCHIHHETLDDKSFNRWVDGTIRNVGSSPASMVDLIRSQKRSILSLPHQSQMPLDIVGALQERRAGLPLLDHIPVLGYSRAAPLPSGALRRHFQYGTEASLLSASRESQLLEIDRLSRMINSYYPSNHGLHVRQLPYLPNIPYGFNILHER